MDRVDSKFREQREPLLNYKCNDKDSPDYPKGN